MKSTAEYSLPASFTPKEQEQLFEEIVKLYDLADDVLASVARENVKNRDVQMALVKPVITQVTNSANILSAFYTEVVRNERPITLELQDTMETALRNIFVAIKEFAEDAQEKLMPQEGKL
jgi:RNAse (barnase) inhibitor barstar